MAVTMCHSNNNNKSLETAEIAKSGYTAGLNLKPLSNSGIKIIEPKSPITPSVERSPFPQMDLDLI